MSILDYINDISISLYCLLYLFSIWFVWESSRSLAKAILKIGRSRSGVKKILKAKTFKEKLFLKNYVEICNGEYKKMKIAMLVNYVYIIYTPILIIILLLSLFLPFFRIVNFIYFLIKLIIIDIPFTLIHLTSTCHAPNGGVEWKFERDYRKLKNKRR